MTGASNGKTIAKPPLLPAAAPRAPLAIPVIVFAIALAVWAWSAQAWLIQDDFVTVLEAPSRWPLKELKELFFPPAAEQSYLRPLPTLTYYVDDLLWGERLVWGWHLTNVLLHAANAAALAWLLLRFGRRVALLAGVIFAVQPVAAEPVTWISARPDLLMAGASILSLAAFASGRRLLSASLFLVAVLSKEAAVSLPLIVTAWVLYRRRNVIKETGWHWAAVSLYVTYRLAALHGIGGRADWSTDPADWVWNILRAFALPLPFNIQGWAEPATLPSGLWVVLAATLAGTACLVLARLRLTWVPLAGMFLAVLPALPLLQLGPSLQFSRYLYFASAFWAVAVAIALNALFTGRPSQEARPACSLRSTLIVKARGPGSALAIAACIGALLAAGTGPRVQFHRASHAAREISASVLSATGRPAPGARALVEGAPARVNGWLLFGGYIGTAAYGRAAAQGGTVQVTDQSWLQETGAAPADREVADIVISVDWPLHEVAACAVRQSAGTVFRDRALDPCLPQQDDELVDLGEVSLFQRAAQGFRWNEGADGTDWAWTVQPHSTFRIRVSALERKTVRLRVASIVENRLEFLVNGVSLGVRTVPSGTRWVDLVFFAGRDLWRADGKQEVAIKAASEEGGLFLAIDRLEILPWVPTSRVDFHSTPLEEYDPQGIAGGDSAGGADWLWLTQGTASIALPFKASADSHLAFRVASDTGALLKVRVGDREAGEFQIPRGHRWVEGGVFVPESLWSAEPLQTLFLGATVAGSGGRVALDWIEDRPVVLQTEFNIGEADATGYAGRGFGFYVRNPDATFQFINSDVAALDLPLRTDGAGRLAFRIASMQRARVAVAVNGESTGMFDLHGGGEFVDAAVLVPASRWDAGPAQHVEMRLTGVGEATPLLLDRVSLGPSHASGRVDLGAAHPATVGGAGFGPRQQAAGVDWHWAEPGGVSLQLPLPADLPPSSEVWLRVMSGAPAVTSVTANARSAGLLEAPGGYRWVWRRVSLPRGEVKPEDGVELALRHTGVAAAEIAIDQIEIRGAPVDSSIDFGPADPGEYSAIGFSAPESDGAEDWAWMTGPRATLQAPIAQGSARQLTVRWMSGAPRRIELAVNGSRIGEASLSGGYDWRTCSFLVPGAAISPAGYQEVLFSASGGADSHFVAIDYLETQDRSGKYQISLGNDDAGCAELVGWRWAEAGGGRTWRWSTTERPGVKFWLDASLAEEVRVIAMSEVGNVLRLSLDGVEIGERRLPGGFEWTELRFPLTRQLPEGASLHTLHLQSTAKKDGLFFAAETIEFVMR